MTIGRARRSLGMITLSLSSMLLACTTTTTTEPSAASAEPVKKAKKELEVTVYRSTFVNSYLIAGKKDAVLVDSQYAKPDVLGLVAWLRASKKRLRTVFLTHAHPDHYYGFDEIKKAFPDAAFVATPGVIAELEASAQFILEGDKQDPNLAPLTPDALVTPAPITSGKLVIDDEELPILDVAHPGESAAAAMLALPSQKALFGGDTFAHRTHLWLAECRSSDWIAELNGLKTSGYEVFYPGHGAKSGPEVLDEDIDYIQKAVPALDAAATPEDAGQALGSMFPTWQGTESPFFMLGIQLYFENCKR
jgi:glyoxylase-like metal-dependent hydrolase (beta-lactamase superfamily II)